MNDSIIIKGLRVFAHHGNGEREKREGQEFTLDIVLHIDLSLSGESDKLEETVDYAAVCAAVQKTMTAQDDNLIERAATRVAQDILGEFPLVLRVDILLSKPHAPISADFGTVMVALSRARVDFTPRD